MKEREFQAVYAFVDQIADEWERYLNSEMSQGLRDALQAASAELPDHMVLSLDFNFKVDDEQRETSLLLLQHGLATSDGDAPYQCSGDSSIERYLCEGEICQLPHDHCPRCWAIWDFKDRNRTCSGCGAELGKEVRILLDSDICPHCEKGKVTMSAPRCSRCGYEVDLDTPPQAAGQITNGSTWHFQAWFRDSAAGGASFDLSDGMAITFRD